VGQYKLYLVRELAAQLRLSPSSQRHLQLNRLEHLIRDVKPGTKYPHNFVTYRLTLYSPPPNAKMVEGGELKANLITLLDELSGTLDIPAPDDAESSLLTLDQVRDLFDVSTKVLANWRRSGLMTRRYIFPDGAQRSAAERAHVEAFVASLGQGPMYRIRVPNVKQRALILSEAHGLAQRGNVSFHEAVRRLAARLEFPPRLVRHAIRSHEMAHPDGLLFPKSVVPLDADRRKELLAEYSAGKEATEIARAVGLSRRQVRAYLKALRAEELLSRDVEYRYDPLFDSADVEADILSNPALDRPAYTDRETPKEVPAYFADLAHRPLLKKDEETALFRKYNYIKYRFAELRQSLKPSEGEDPKLLAKLETLADGASTCRERLVEANLRLVVKLARQHSGPMTNINDLISEGNMVLLKAVEKFDFTRGVRFSTYATWCVVKRFARVVPEENYRIKTYMTGADEVIEIQPDESVVELERKESLAHMRAQIGEVLTHLNEREGEILTRRFGLAGSPQTLEQIGNALGITRERVRQLETRALRKAGEAIGHYHG
jgi:RNA polymerase primary sigma factor